jgi:phenylacetate-CoA ligase
MTSDQLTLHHLTRAGIERLQIARFQALLTEIVPRNRFWSERLTQAGIGPEDIRSLADLGRLPFTTKGEVLADQRDNSPFGSNLTYPPEIYSRMHQTSGTTGTPMRWLDTAESWNQLLDSWARLFGLMGLRRSDRLLFAFSFGPFLGFWAGFEGASRLGNLCLPAGGMSTESRLAMILENDVTVVACTPTYAMRLAEVASEIGIDLHSSLVRSILVAGEPGGNIPATRRRIEEAWGARVVDHWGMTELGPLAIESEVRPGGLSVLETDCIAEIIDPATGLSVAPGDEGELVITNLGRTGSPLIRYRTGDRVRAGSSADAGPPADVFLFLEGGILGRTDDMLTIRGNNLYPAALEDAIREFPNVAEFRIELRTIKAMQELRIEIEPAAELDSASVTRLLLEISATIKQRWHFHAEVQAVSSGSLPRFEMKARRFVRVG